MQEDIQALVSFFLVTIIGSNNAAIFVKLDSSGGNDVCHEVYTGPGGNTEEVLDAILDSNEDLVACGYNGPNMAFYKLTVGAGSFTTLAKTDAGASPGCRCKAIVQNGASGYVLAGTIGDGVFTGAAFVQAVDITGTYLWSKTLSSGDISVFEGVVKLSTGNFLVTGWNKVTGGDEKPVVHEISSSDGSSVYMHIISVVASSKGMGKSIVYVNDQESVVVGGMPMNDGNSYYIPWLGTTICPAGSYISDTPDYTCKTCSSGTTLNPNSRACVAASCTAGQYATESSCVDCPVGTYCLSGCSSSCTKCAAGTYTNTTKASSCTKCPAGNYSASEGSTECVQCIAGQYAAEGSSACTGCPLGTSSNAGAANCTACPKNQFSDMVGGICQDCPEGYISEAGAKNCTACPAGYYTGNGGCNKCPAGTYSSVEKSKDCTKCDAGYYSVNGSVACIPCDAGTTSISGSATCTPCIAGTYSAIAGANRCVQCDPGWYNDKANSISCFKCSPGFYADQYGSTLCNKCPMGYYSDTDGTATCKGCGNNTFSTVVGSVTINDCESCPKDTYSYIGFSTCIKCTVLNDSAAIQPYFVMKNESSKEDACYLSACPKGYINWPGSVYCKKCDKSCKECSKPYDPYACTYCYLDFVVIDGKCVRLLSNWVMPVFITLAAALCMGIGFGIYVYISKRAAEQAVAPKMNFQEEEEEKQGEGADDTMTPTTRADGILLNSARPVSEDRKEP